MKRTFTSLLAAAAVVPALWFVQWPAGDTACADPSYRFQVAMDTQANREAATLAKSGACRTVNSLTR